MWACLSWSDSRKFSRHPAVGVVCGDCYHPFYPFKQKEFECARREFSRKLEKLSFQFFLYVSLLGMVSINQRDDCVSLSVLFSCSYAKLSFSHGTRDGGVS